MTRRQKINLGFPIHCRKHGDHCDWRTESSGSVRCFKCLLERKAKWAKTKPLYTKLYNAKQRALKKGLDYSLTPAFIEQLFQFQNQCCALTGTKFESVVEASIDRIDSSKGYTPDNVQLVTNQANTAKNVLSTEVFIELCKKVIKKNESIQKR